MNSENKSLKISGIKNKMPFGHQYSSTSNDINQFYDLITGVTPTLRSYEVLGNSKKFEQRSAFLELKDLTVAASVCSPITYEVDEDHGIYFILPFHGEATCKIENQNYISSASHGAMMIPGQHRRGATTNLSMLQATLNADRLKSTALAMMGHNSRPIIEKRFQSPQMLPMNSGKVRFDRLFYTLCQTIDDCHLQNGILNNLGFDDIFYRSVINMLFFDHFENYKNQFKYSRNSQINLICEYIEANLTEPIYLTDLEKISDLSARSMQYAFMRESSCSPTAWIRQRRLQLAHQRLLRASPSDSVTRIALDCGFSNSSDFARLYLDTYGQSPKLTLKNASR